MNRSILIAIIMALVAVLWILSGTMKEDVLNGSADKALEDGDSKNRAFKVRIERQSATEMEERIDLQGGIEAGRVIDLKSEIESTVETIKAKKGDLVSASQSLLTLAVNDRQARLERAKADLRVSQLDLESGLSLKKKKLLSENQHQQNIAAVTGARAQVKEIETEIEHTKIQAPFDGVLDDVYVELGDYVSPGTAIARIVDNNALKITTQVPQQHIAKIRLGQRVEAKLLDGMLVTGRVSYISSSADLMTRSFTVEATTVNATKVQFFGQSARVSIIVGKQLSHKLSPAMLSLDKEGALQVKGVDTDGLVVDYKVGLIRSENDGVWLSGLPKEFDLITVGHGFVSAGERVDIVSNDDVYNSPTQVGKTSEGAQ